MRHETLDSMKMISNLLQVKVDAIKVTSAWDAPRVAQFLERLKQLEISAASFREMMEETLKDEHKFYIGEKKYEDEDRDPAEYTFERYDGISRYNGK